MTNIEEIGKCLHKMSQPLQILTGLIDIAAIENDLGQIDRATMIRMRHTAYEVGDSFRSCVLLIKELKEKEK
jgi:hypothetical protein